MISKTSLNLRHYGNSEYDGELFFQIENSPHRNKPTGGLWTSPIESTWGWKDWSTCEGWGDLSLHFDLRFHGTTFKVDNESDMYKLPWCTGSPSSRRLICFESLVSAGYDAMHLTAKGEERTRLTDHMDLYGWDCETVLIFNQESIQAVI